MEPDSFIAVFEDIDRRIKAETDLRKHTEEAEERAIQLRALASEMIHAEDQERRRIAQLLHDELRRLLVAASFSFQRVRKQVTDGQLGLAGEFFAENGVLGSEKTDMAVGLGNRMVLRGGDSSCASREGEYRQISGRRMDDGTFEQEEAF